MHELSICQGLIRNVERIAAENGASAVQRIVLSIGALAGVEPALLQNAFKVVQPNTVAAQAELEIRSGAVRIRCQECGNESDIAGYRLLCHYCESWQVEVITGTELLLLQLELSGLPATPTGSHPGEPVIPGPLIPGL